MFFFLSITASDSCGAAGIQQDLKMAQKMGFWGLSAITAISSQNFEMVENMEIMKEKTFFSQLEIIFNSFKISAIKIGILPKKKFALKLSKYLSQIKCPIVYDPVLKSSSGFYFYKDDPKEIFDIIYPHCTVVTPNIPEFEYFFPELLPPFTREGRDAFMLSTSVAEISDFPSVGNALVRSASVGNALIPSEEKHPSLNEYIPPNMNVLQTAVGNSASYSASSISLEPPLTKGGKSASYCASDRGQHKCVPTEAERTSAFPTEADSINASLPPLAKGGKINTAIYLKGGHCENGEITEYLFQNNEVKRYEYERESWKFSRGTGCAFSSLLSMYLVDNDLETACIKARKKLVEHYTF